MDIRYCVRVHIVTCEDDQHCYAIAGDSAAQIVQAGLAEPCIGPFTAFVKTIRLTVPTYELRQQFDLRNRRSRRPKPTMRPPDSSTGGGDQGLAPLIGRFHRLHFPPVRL